MYSYQYVMYLGCIRYRKNTVVYGYNLIKKRAKPKT